MGASPCFLAGNGEPSLLELGQPSIQIRPQLLLSSVPSQHELLSADVAADDFEDGGEVIRNPNECFCGNPIQPFVSATDWMEHQDGTATPYGPERQCTDCRWKMMHAENVARKAWEILRAYLLTIPRPRLGHPHRQDWVDARKPHDWVSAKKWNKCVRCSRPHIFKKPWMCLRCGTSHQQFLIDFPALDQAEPFKYSAEA